MGPEAGAAATAKRDGPGGFPRCRRCGWGELVSLSDFGPEGGEVRFKAWVCTDPACGFAVHIRRGEIVRARAPRKRPAPTGERPLR